MQEWASLIFVVVSLYMTVSAIFAVMFWVIVVRLELTPSPSEADIAHACQSCRTIGREGL